MLSVTNAEAESSPSWVRRPPNEDAKWYYVIGRSSYVDNESQAYTEAYNDAATTFIREVIGVRRKVRLDTYETSEDARVVKRSAEDSPQIQVKLKQVDSYKEKTTTGFNLAVLYRHSKTEIESEKSRIAKVKEPEVELTLISIREDDLVGRKTYQAKRADGNKLIVSDLDAFSREHPWTIYIGIPLTDKTVNDGRGFYGFELGVERRFWRIGIKLSGAYLFGRSGNEESYSASGFMGRVSTPIYFSHFIGEVKNSDESTEDTHDGLYLEPEVGLFQYSYKNGAGVNTPTINVIQTFYGGGIGYQYFFLTQTPESPWYIGADFRVGFRVHRSTEGSDVNAINGTLGLAFKF